MAGLWDALGRNRATSLDPYGGLIFNQFCATGPNYAYVHTLSGGILSKGLLDHLINQFSLPHAPNNQFIPFLNVKAYESSASSFYHGLTVTLRKRLAQNYQVLGSWTWSHAIDDATDIQTFEEPQDNSNARLDRGNSNFDQRHRFGITGVAEVPIRRSGDLWKSMFSDWTLAPRIESSSGRPFRLLTRTDRTLVNSSSTARPSVVPFFICA